MRQLRKIITKYKLWVWSAALLALFVGSLVPSFLRQQQQGYWSQCKSNQKNIVTALEMYAKEYLRTLPEFRGAGRMSYRAEFGKNASLNDEKLEKYFCIECAGSNHKAVGTLAGWPRCNSTQAFLDRPWW